MHFRSTKKTFFWSIALVSGIVVLSGCEGTGLGYANEQNEFNELKLLHDDIRSIRDEVRQLNKSINQLHAVKKDGTGNPQADEELIKILASVKAQFGYTPKPGSTDPLDIAVMQVLAQKQTGGSLKDGQNWRAAEIKGKFEKERDNWMKSQSPIGKPFYFERDSAVMTNASEEQVKSIAEIITKHYRLIVIQGHCSDEESSTSSDGGYDLTFRRAKAVMDLLIKHDVPEKRVAIVALSSNASPRNIKSEDRQLALVRLGSYFLPAPSEGVNQDVDSPTTK